MLPNVYLPYKLWDFEVVRLFFQKRFGGIGGGTKWNRFGFEHKFNRLGQGFESLPLRHSIFLSSNFNNLTVTKGCGKLRALYRTLFLTLLLRHEWRLTKPLSGLLKENSMCAWLFQVNYVEFWGGKLEKALAQLIGLKQNEDCLKLECSWIKQSKQQKVIWITMRCEMR